LKLRPYGAIQMCILLLLLLLLCIENIMFYSTETCIDFCVVVCGYSIV